MQFVGRRWRPHAGGQQSGYRELCGRQRSGVRVVGPSSDRPRYLSSAVRGGEGNGEGAEAGPVVSLERLLGFICRRTGIGHGVDARP